MYTTTSDRRKFAARNAEWVETYGTEMPTLRRNLGRIMATVLMIVAGAALLGALIMAGSHALAVSDCQHMIATSGATDSPAVVACVNFLK